MHIPATSRSEAVSSNPANLLSGLGDLRRAERVARSAGVSFVTRGAAAVHGSDPGARETGTPMLPMFKGPQVAPGGPLRVRVGATERALDRPLRLGSGPDNDWVIDDPFVSARHLVLCPDGALVRLADRGSRNGTYVGGVRVERAVLAEGACVTLGRTQLRIVGPQASRPATELVGQSAAMEALRGRLARLAPLPLPVLCLGESGTGKELVARALHEQSGRRGAFIAVNCGALPRELIESELFGHEKGAFTGAERRRPGCFLEADGGTLFLDEIGELPLDLQPRLLRALEQRAVRPVGGEREVPVDVRIVAATHRDLGRAVAEGRFREDLYYRLLGVELRLPALRDRPEDIPALCARFLGELRGAVGPVELGAGEVAQLQRYPWPGNVRQLRSALVRAAHLCGPVLRAADVLPEREPAAAGWSTPAAGFHQGPAPAAQPGWGSPAADHGPGPAPAPMRRLAELEREAVAEALRQTGNNRRKAAALLGVPKSTLCDRLRRMGL